MKSSDASQKAATAALEAAGQTFASDGALPFDQDIGSRQGPNEGRRRLSGAFLIDIERIEPDPYQPRKRIDALYIDELTQSVRSHGILQPISVRYIESTNRYRIVAGECRFTAAKRAGLTELPCWVKTPKENEVLVEQLIENWHRSDLNAFELADALAILRDANGWNQQQLAEETGKSKGEISKLLAILSLDAEVQSVARADASGRISKHHLYAVSRLPVSLQHTAIEKIGRDQLTGTDIEKLAEREQKRQQGIDTRGPQYFRRTFKTSKGNVTFAFRSETLTDADVLEALHEIKRQIVKHDG